METVFRLKTSELTPDFLSILKTLFKERELEIIIHESKNKLKQLIYKEKKQEKSIGQE